VQIAEHEQQEHRAAKDEGPRPILRRCWLRLAGKCTPPAFLGIARGVDGHASFGEPRAVGIAELRREVEIHQAVVDVGAFPVAANAAPPLGPRDVGARKGGVERAFRFRRERLARGAEGLEDPRFVGGRILTRRVVARAGHLDDDAAHARERAELQRERVEPVCTLEIPEHPLRIRQLVEIRGLERGGAAERRQQQAADENSRLTTHGAVERGRNVRIRLVALHRVGRSRSRTSVGPGPWTLCDTRAGGRRDSHGSTPGQRLDEALLAQAAFGTASDFCQAGSELKSVYQRLIST